MGLPQLDFRVPEATWFKSVLAGKFGVLPGLGASGTLAWPYKIAVVAVMSLVAGGTLVTFGSAGAETPTSSEVSALPGSDEASPTVEGQVLPPSPALLNADDLMSSLNLTDFSPGEGATLSLSDDDDNDDGDEDTDTTKKKTSTSTSKPTTKPTTGTKTPTKSPSTPAPSPKPTTSEPTTPAPTPTKTAEPEPVCRTVKTWVPGNLSEGKLGHYETKEVCD